MRRITRGLAIACTCAAATASLTGVALADKATAPGQERTADTAQVQAQGRAATDVSVSATVGVEPSNGRSDEAHAAAHGQAKQASSPAADTSAGVEPSDSTTSVMWTQCTAGGATTSATCTATRSSATASVEADASKRYGNGTTAARIAVGRGGAGATLTGPGNSQPHKVSLCGKPGNPSGGVDVHAVKGYGTSGCQQTSVPSTTRVAATVGSAADANAAPVTSAVVQASPPASASRSGTAAASSGPTSANASTAAGGVLAAHASVTKPKGGVLGEVTNVAGSTLPFTGFPLGLVALAALGLIGGGLALRRSGAATHV